VTVIGGLASFGWGLALGFSMGVISVVSALILIATPKEALELDIGPVRERMFKGEGTSASLRVGRSSERDAAEVELYAVPDGLEADLTGEGAERVLKVSSKFAGVFRGLKVKVGITDPLKLFVRKETHQLDLAFEFLPTYLLARREPLRVPAAMLGDYPGGRSGLGQEFYSAEMYTPSSPSRDILWKRQAKMPAEELMVRVGEANIPERLTACFIQRTESANRHAPWLMDLASEAIARVGLPVVSSGMRFRLLHLFEGKTTVAEARDLAGLANLLVSIWRDDVVKGWTDSEPGEADIIITAELETQDPAIRQLVVEKPSVILTWGSKEVAGGSTVVFFTGHEEVRGLVARVLSK
jgi:hypothetical protein